jgi:hypothetical protein
MICIGIFLSFLIYVRIFSVNQFGKISKGVGGGKPEIVYLAFSDEHCGVAKSMNLLAVQNHLSTNVLFGPVGIILKADNEITFLNYSEMNIPQSFTNGMHLSYVTNLIAINLNQTNREKSQIIITNIVNDTLTNIFYNSGGLAARQIRADLIDGVIYNR